MTLEVDTGGMAVENEPSHQYPITLCCCVTDGSRGVVWWNGVWRGSAYEAKVCCWISLCGKKWHLLTFSDAWWTFIETKQWMWTQWGSRWCVSAVATAAHLHWHRFLLAQHAGSCSSLAKMHNWLHWNIVFCSWKLSVLCSVIVLFVSIVVSMEINRRHYFWSNLHIVHDYCWAK